ncbi:hypothetical protein KKB55_09330 [Myxococcota bacterium]|nr:hypothetical protein [Myxococcota bacterium]MBU1897935.1 hypothetical protein [Myxococcota bacterium]
MKCAYAPDVRRAVRARALTDVHPLSAHVRACHACRAAAIEEAVSLSGLIHLKQLDLAEAPAPFSLQRYALLGLLAGAAAAGLTFGVVQMQRYMAPIPPAAQPAPIVEPPAAPAAQPAPIVEPPAAPIVEPPAAPTVSKKRGGRRRSGAKANTADMDDLLGALDGKKSSAAPPAVAAQPAAQLSKWQVLRVIKAGAVQIKRCEVEGEGMVTVKITIQHSGEVASAAVIGANAGSPLARCVEREVRALRFPPFSGAPMIVNMPFKLSPSPPRRPAAPSPAR